jgi:hypothetical protein
VYTVRAANNGGTPVRDGKKRVWSSFLEKTIVLEWHSQVAISFNAIPANCRMKRMPPTKFVEFVYLPHSRSKTTTSSNDLQKTLIDF